MTTKITKAELIKKLKGLLTDYSRADHFKNEEDIHMEADALLLEFIDDAEVTKSFDSLPKWYA